MELSIDEIVFVDCGCDMGVVIGCCDEVGWIFWFKMIGMDEVGVVVFVFV